MELPATLHDTLVECAHQEGFPLAETVDLDLVLADPSQPFQKHVERYDHWIQSGFSGSMEYLVRGRDRRADPRILFPSAQSILCVAIPYPRRPAGASSFQSGPRYARYLQGHDYHLEIADRLTKVMNTAKVKLQRIVANDYDLNWKICVDTSAVLERSWAALAGLGWIGKNTLLIHPKYGSYLFLGEVLINQKTGRGPSPLPSYCGHCTRCLDSCPTSAFEKPNVLNSNRCTSYLTLEKRGDLKLSQQEQNKMGPWIAGCDICQEVCPFNIKASRDELGQPQTLPANATQLNTWQALLSETKEDYKIRVKTSAMNRIKPAQFSRNLAISLKNHIQTLDPKEKDKFVFELQPLIERRAETEEDEISKVEWQRCLEVVQSPNRTP